MTAVFAMDIIQSGTKRPFDFFSVGTKMIQNRSASRSLKGLLVCRTIPALIESMQRSLNIKVPVVRRLGRSTRVSAQKNDGKNVEKAGFTELGPISLSYQKKETKDAGFLELGPIGMTVGPGKENGSRGSGEPSGSGTPAQSISTMTTEEWRKRYENEDGSIDLWVEEEFNSGSRLIGGRAVYLGREAGLKSGEGPSLGEVPVHTVTITNVYQENKVFTVQMPEDRYILYEAEDQGLELPWACRMGCCTACAVKVKSGQIYQPEALGISKELKEAGYALMCVGFPLTDCELETVTEDEIYDLQFGEVFAQRALDPNNPEYVQRDDYALEVALGDE